MSDQISSGMRALLLVLGSAVLGAVYFLYLNAEPFPPGIMRLVPIVWLALALDIPNSVFAAVFSMAALMGG